MPMIWAQTPDGRRVKFDMRSQQGGGRGYMLNEEMLEDGRLSDGADRVTLTLYAQELSRGDDEGAQEYVQIGEPFEVELSSES